MTEVRPKPPHVKGDRNPHEVSGDESPPAEARGHHTKGGGHRSGSRGAGTLEDVDGERLPAQGPGGAARRQGSTAAAWLPAPSPFAG